MCFLGIGSLSTMVIIILLISLWINTVLFDALFFISAYLLFFFIKKIYFDRDFCLSFRFPETLIPTFKVTAAKSLQKVRIGEEISLVRFVIHYLT